MTDNTTDRTVPVIDATTGRARNTGRRRFLANTGMYTAGLMGSALLGACGDSSSHAQNSNNVSIGGPPDEDILNFALNLEYLEAQYYVHAVTGNGLRAADLGDDPGMLTPPVTNMVDFSSNKLIGSYAAEIAADELHHVKFFRAALGKSAVDAPAIDLKGAFETLGGLVGVENFDPYASPENFLLGAFILEDVGVTAFHGAAQFIKNRVFIDAAAGILATEAYHAGIIRSTLAALDYANGNTDFTQLTKKISDVRDSVDGESDDDQGLGAPNMVEINGSNYSSSNIVPTDGNGIVYGRSIPNVLNIVYANPGQVSKGAFYPNGINLPGLNMSADTTAM